MIAKYVKMKPQESTVIKLAWYQDNKSWKRVLLFLIIHFKSLIIPHNFFLQTLQTKYAKQQLFQKHFARDPPTRTCKKETQPLRTGLRRLQLSKKKLRGKSKGKGVPVYAVRACGQWRLISTINIDTRWRQFDAVVSLCPEKQIPAPIKQRAGGSQGRSGPF